MYVGASVGEAEGEAVGAAVGLGVGLPAVYVGARVAAVGDRLGALLGV